MTTTMTPSDRDLASGNVLFRGVDFETISYMLERCTVRTLTAGELLLQPDVPNHHLYLILSGKLTVRLGAYDTSGYVTMSAGECAGEVSIGDGKPPSASVVAEEGARVMAVPKDTVWSLVDHSHEVARNLLALVAGRMRHGNRTLVTIQSKKAQFEHQASVDALTGIHNRRWMNDTFPRALRRCALDRAPFSLLIADLDHFKRINDTHGHLAGDAALRSVARCLEHHLRPHDLLVRYGGEEFAVLLPDTQLADAKLVAERLRTLIAETVITHAETTFTITISIGVSHTDRETTLERMIADADVALYRAKELGRNRTEVTEPAGPP